MNWVERLGNGKVATTIALLVLGLTEPSAVRAQQERQTMSPQEPDAYIALLTRDAREACQWIRTQNYVPESLHRSLLKLLEQKVDQRTGVPVAVELLRALWDARPVELDVISGARSAEVLARSAMALIGETGTGSDDAVNVLVHVLNNPRTGAKQVIGHKPRWRKEIWPGPGAPAQTYGRNGYSELQWRPESVPGFGGRPATQWYRDVRAGEEAIFGPGEPLPHLRVEAVKSLARLNSPRVNAELMKACERELLSVRIEAIDGLTQRGAKEAIPLFLEFLKRTELPEDQRAAAARSLGKIPAAQTVPQLVEMLTRDNPLSVRDALAGALGELGAKADMSRNEIEALAQRLELEALIQPQTSSALDRAAQGIRGRLKKMNVP